MILGLGTVPYEKGRIGVKGSKRLFCIQDAGRTPNRIDLLLSFDDILRYEAVDEMANPVCESITVLYSEPVLCSTLLALV